MRIHRSYNRKIPTELEVHSFFPRKSWDIWISLPDSWCCPVCGRGKRELMRWKRGKGNAEGKWTCSLHKHHDHGTRWEGLYLICGDCNAADGIAKRILKLPSDWSFSPQELKSFVKCEPNGTLESVDLDVAWDIFEQHMGDYFF